MAVLEHSGCQESDDLEITAAAINVDDAYTNSILVFPNPSDGSQTFRVTLNEPGMVGLRVMDIKGRIVDKTPAWKKYNPYSYFDISDLYLNF